MQQLPPLLRGQAPILLQQYVCGPHDARERCADIMAHAPQKISAHFLPLHLPLRDLHLLGPAGQGAGQDGNGHHYQEGQRKARQGEADVPIGLSKYVVHAEYAQYCTEDTEQVPIRQHRREEHIR